jgi:hypothetical protein
LQWRHQFGPSAGQLALPGGSAVNPVWRILWQLKIPSKVKILLWRAGHGIIPLKRILVYRHSGNPRGCHISNLGLEDVSHLLFRCLTTKDLWAALGLSEAIDEVGQVDRSGSAVLEVLLCRQDNSLNGYVDFGVKEVIVIAC